MEPSQFDALTKALARSTTRRQALKTVAVMALGGLGLGGLTQVLAKKPHQEHCQKKGQHCNPRRGVRCCEDLVCSHPTGGICIPSNPCPDQTLCGETCVNTENDPNNCGLCGHVCASGETCVNGSCTCGTHGDCPAGQNCCSGMCVNEQSDSQNCGLCGNVCPSGQICQNGVCVFPCLQQPCSSPSDCCGSASGQVTCTNTNCSTASVCCTLAGPCSGDCDCCGGICDPTTHMCTCFTAGTLIAMADGTSRPIERVLVGDLVLGNAGRVNRVGEVLRPVLGHRHLYALNESNFFVTAGHPFLTEAGWKAIDPSATPPQHSALHIGRLTVGDRLLTLAAAAVPVGVGGSISTQAVDVRIDAVRLHSLVGRPADPATQLYNLRLDGDHTYFANDLLVHNK